MLTDQALPVPALADADIIRAVAGIRPCRRGGLRLETERVSLNGRSKTVVHNYGQGGCGVTLALGCAERAADLIDAQLVEAGPGPGASVAVLGGGVIGLASAHELAARGRAVTVYADKVGTDTTSAVAGALWLPTGLDFPEPGPARERLNELLRRSDARLRALDGTRWGIESLPVYEPASAPQHAHHFESGAIDHPRDLDHIPIGVERGPGSVFETLFVHTPRFLRALVDDLRARGVAIQRRRFGSIDDVLALEEHAVVNCLALGSRELFGDDAMYPARGVLVHARPQRLGYVVHDGYKYLFPRDDALIMGGTFEEGVTDPTPPDQTVRDILAHHRRFFGLDERG